MGAEVRIRPRNLLDAFVVWACNTNPVVQERALRILAADARAAGATCSTHALALGYFIGWGRGAREWAEAANAHLVGASKARGQRKNGADGVVRANYQSSSPPDWEEAVW